MQVQRFCPNGHGILVETLYEYSCLTCGYSLTKKKVKKVNHANLIPEKIREKLEIALSEIKRDMFSKTVSETLLPWKQERWLCVPRANYVSKREYTGWNRMFMWNMKDDFYLTKKQIEKLGGSLKDDACPVYVIGWFPVQRKKGETQEEFIERTKFRKFFSMLIEVWPWSTTIGIPEKLPVECKFNERKESIDTFISRLSTEKSLQIEEAGQRSCYNNTKDNISIPLLSHFVSSDMYYKSLFHEIIHWTGKRCDREMSQEREKYGREELIAEIGSAALCHLFNINMGTDSTEYIAGWMDAINEDMSVLLEASGRAEKAIEFLFN